MTVLILLLMVAFLLGYAAGAFGESCRYPCPPDPYVGRWYE